MEKPHVLVVPTRTTDIPGFPPLPDMQVELHVISAHTYANVLPEPVTWLNVMGALLNGDEYNIVHFCGHLEDDFLILANERISVDGLVMMFRNSPEHRKLIFFNTCSSVDAARRLATATPCDIIYTNESIENADAIRFAIKFYSTLSQADTFRDAFNASIGDENKFGYIKGVGKHSVEDVSILRGGSSEVALIRADLNELKTLMTGGLLGRGLIWEMGELREQYETLERRLSEFEVFKSMLRVMYDATLLSTGKKRDGASNHTWQYILLSIAVGLAVSLLGNYWGGG